jgi:cysteine synthase
MPISNANLTPAPYADRIAKVMLQRAEARGDLVAPDGSKKTILAASSGNTGCSLALIGTLMGYEVRRASVRFGRSPR